MSYRESLQDIAAVNVTGDPSFIVAAMFRFLGYYCTQGSPIRCLPLTATGDGLYEDPSPAIAFSRRKRK